MRDIHLPHNRRSLCRPRLQRGATCSFPVLIDGSDGDTLQRVIIKGKAAERCLPLLKKDTAIQVFGVRKLRPLQYGHDYREDALLEQIVAWSVKLHGSNLTLLEGGNNEQQDE